MTTIRLLATLAIVLWLPQTIHADYLRLSRSATVRNKPSRDSKIIERGVRNDEFVLSTTRQSNGWYEVQLQNSFGTGWIYRTMARRYRGLPHEVDTAQTGFVPVEYPAKPFTSNQLEIHVINIGQGDAIYIRCPDGNHELLIDSGDYPRGYPNSSREFRKYLVEHQGRNNPIEAVVASHPHADHIGSLDWVLNNYRVNLFVDNQNTRQGNNTFDRVTKALTQARQSGHTEYWGAQNPTPPNIDFCPRPDVSARLVRPRGFGHDHDPNNNSVVVRVDYGGNSFLFVGDSEFDAERMLIDDPKTSPLLDCDFLKTGHHGSATSSSVEFLNKVTPEVIAISCGIRDVGSNARYMHPRSEVVRRLLNHAKPRSSGDNIVIDAFSSKGRYWESITLSKQVHITAAEGDLVFESDGNGIRKR